MSDSKGSATRQAQVDAPLAPRRERERLFIPMVLLAIVLTTVLFQRIPKAHELSIVEGPVTQAKWIGSRRARFVVWLDDHPSPFQPQPPKELPVPIADMIKPGMTARIGYTGASVGYFGLNNNLEGVRPRD